MSPIKTYKMSCIKVTVELDENLTIEENCPGDNDLVVFVQDHLLLHLKRN